MREITCLCASLLVLIYTSSHVNGYSADYSDRTWPYMVLRVANLEMERKELIYGDKVIPKKKGLIELECNVARSSLSSSLGMELHKELAGIEWNVPNSKMLEEKRAFIKEPGTQDPKLQSFLVITDFNAAEDAGEYSCRIAFKHEHITRYQQKIFIPSLDGAPIFKCEFECQRNKDEACQLMERYDIKCESYSKSRSFHKCDFQECDAEEACFLTPLPAIYSDIPGDFFSRPTPMYRHKSGHVTGGLAKRSGMFNCETTSSEGSAVLRLYMPVTVNDLKDRIPIRRVPGHPSARLPNKPEELSGTYKNYERKIYEFGCWTSKEVGPFEWSFRSIANREWSKTLSSNPGKGIEIKNLTVAGGHGSVLHIQGASKKHGGYYFCEAVNNENRLFSHRQFEISAGAWKKDANVPKKSTITRHTGSSVTLKCTMRTTGSNIVTWIKVDPDGLSSGNVGPETNIELSHDYEILTIHNLTVSDSGTYKCYDTFDVNSLDAEVTLSVVDQPFDRYEQIENLQDAIKALRDAEDEISEIVQSIAPDAQERGTRDEDDDDSSEEDSSEEEKD